MRAVCKIRYTTITWKHHCLLGLAGFRSETQRGKYIWNTRLVIDSRWLNGKLLPWGAEEYGISIQVVGVYFSFCLWMHGLSCNNVFCKNRRKHKEFCRLILSLCMKGHSAVGSVAPSCEVVKGESCYSVVRCMFLFHCTSATAVMLFCNQSMSWAGRKCIDTECISKNIHRHVFFSSTKYLMLWYNYHLRDRFLIKQ